MPTPNKPFLVVLDLTADEDYQAITNSLQEYENTRLHDAATEDETARLDADNQEAVRLAGQRAAAARRDAAAAHRLYIDIERQLDES